MNTVEKLALLRSKMQENNIGAFVVYSADPHLSEYLPNALGYQALLALRAS